jgi:S-adenosylmethionine:tRNA ribosyltransferase-isomerase
MEEHQHPKYLNIGHYHYTLPESRIAQFPLEIRDQSKLLICKKGLIEEDVFSNLSSHLPAGSLAVFNETRVIHARLLFHKESGSPIEIFCLEPLAPFRDHQQAFQQKEQSEWQCLVGNSKRWRTGKIELRAEHDGQTVIITAERVMKFDGGTSQVRFSWTPANVNFAEVLELTGKIPLPPYINRKPVKKDEETYQTIYARHDGSVAAPTAGLHFSEEVMSSLKKNKTEILKFILHVGAGTFRPVISHDLGGHQMHAEQVYLPLEYLEKLIISLHKPVIAVGTTTTRLLESLYWHGVRVINGLSEGHQMNVGQWDPYDLPGGDDISREDALDAVIRECKRTGAAMVKGQTSLLIAPGYKFRYPDILITNFHQPGSTLLLLIATFIGEDWKKAYQYALDHDFRFLSYGDSCLFFRALDK